MNGVPALKSIIDVACYPHGIHITNYGVSVCCNMTCLGSYQYDLINMMQLNWVEGYAGNNKI